MQSGGRGQDGGANLTHMWERQKMLSSRLIRRRTQQLAVRSNKHLIRTAGNTSISNKRRHSRSSSNVQLNFTRRV